MKKVIKIILIGDGDNSEVIYDFIKKNKDYSVEYIIGKKNSNRNFSKIKHLNYNFNFKNLLNDYFFLCTIADNYNRKKIVNFFNIKYKKKIKWVSLIGHNVTLETKVKIGKGSIIFPYTNIGYNTKIGNFCLINHSCHIEHHNKFKNFTSVGPKVVTGGNVTIGKYSYIGINSTINHNLKISENVIVGAKSLITKNCKNNSTYFGHPAKFIKKRKFGDKYL